MGTRSLQEIVSRLGSSQLWHALPSFMQHSLSGAPCQVDNLCRLHLGASPVSPAVHQQLLQIEQCCLFSGAVLDPLVSPFPCSHLA